MFCIHITYRQVGWENERNNNESVDDEADRGGVALTSQSRLELMQKLSDSKDAGLVAPHVTLPTTTTPAAAAAPVPFVPGTGVVPTAPLPFVPVGVAPVMVAPTIVAPAPVQTRCLKLRNMFNPNRY